MKSSKVFIVHGFNSSPNSSWIPWLLRELKTKNIYASSLVMPSPDIPQKDEWVHEIIRTLSFFPEDDIYLVGYSLGCAAVLHAISKYEGMVAGGVLVSGRVQKSDNVLTQNFYESFDFEKIKSHIGNISIIHGDNDSVVPVDNAFIMGNIFNTEPILIPNGDHLRGSDGFLELPQVLTELLSMMK